MATTDTRTTKQPTSSMVDDISTEVKHEMHNIRYVKEPVDPTQSDRVVGRHVAGISISFFVVIVLFLVAVIGGVAWYEHAHPAPQTPTHQSTSIEAPSRAVAA